MKTVSTKEALALAKRNNEVEIVVVGHLAEKVKSSKKIAALSVISIAVLGGAVGLATIAGPETGGLSIIAAAPVLGWSGLEVSAVIIAASLGLGLIIALSKDYEEISYEKGQLVLRKKSK